MEATPNLMTPNERKMLEAVLYYREIGANWCFIERQLRCKRDELERLVCLHNQEEKEKR